jgi:hypothetical protein
MSLTAWLANITGIVTSFVYFLSASCGPHEVVFILVPLQLLQTALIRHTLFTPSGYSLFHMHP